MTEHDSNVVQSFNQFLCFVTKLKLINKVIGCIWKVARGVVTSWWVVAVAGEQEGRREVGGANKIALKEEWKTLSKNLKNKIKFKKKAEIVPEEKSKLNN